ncbi:MAG: flagellar basal body L-ring protein FlgH [Rubrivivax sp.]|nr:flagellar basal body L-ring protein FlgH [Rubrivivax sp.]
MGVVFLVMTGCATFNAPPKVDLADTRPVQAMPTVQAPPTNGSIFQMSQYRPLFEDHRARLVGDSLTINIVEKVSASQSSNSSVDKSGSLEGALKAVPLFKPNPLDRASVSGSSNSAFAGKGATENTNDFSGVITVIVTGVLPNGHLQIAGEKQIGVNDNVDVLRFSGQVDPRTIQPGNMVASGMVANVRVQHRGRGPAAEANRIGWLSRFFLNVLPI